MGHQQASRAAVAGKRRGNNTSSNNNSTGSNILSASRRLLVTAAVLFGAALPALPAQAQSGPFAGMAGRWAGGGTVTLDDGSTERIRCRATYAVAGPEMNLSLTCASDAYKFNLEGRVVAEAGGVISGSWSESSRNISGTLQGRGGNGNFQVVASTAGFNASIALATRGARQSISMRADSQFRAANIALSR
jgi:hypothetical protein